MTQRSLPGLEGQPLRRRPDPERIRELAERGATIREICDELDVGYSSVRYWIVKLGLETERMRRRRLFEDARRHGLARVNAPCRHHGLTTFLKRSDGAFRCLQCSSASLAKRRRRVKQTLVDEAGGRCAACGFDRHPSALQFHHLDREEKEFGIGRHGITRAIAAVREEAGKCVLLCANCHALVEAGVIDVPLADGRYSGIDATEESSIPK